MAVLMQNRYPPDVTVLQDATGPHRSSLIQRENMTGPAVETVMLQIRGHLLLTYEHLVSDGANRLFLLSIRGLNDSNHGSRSHFSFEDAARLWGEEGVQQPPHLTELFRVKRVKHDRICVVGGATASGVNSAARPGIKDQRQPALTLRGRSSGGDQSDILRFGFWNRYSVGQCIQMGTHLLTCQTCHRFARSPILGAPSYINYLFFPG